MKPSAKLVLVCFLFLALFTMTGSLYAQNQDKQWVRFTYDKDKADTNYYYDRQAVQYLSENRVSTWLRIGTPEGDDFILVEIECSTPMFRTVQPYKPLFFKPDKTSYVAYGWLEVPPDSEIYLLRNILCKKPK